jgi:hypothetical protein
MTILFLTLIGLTLWIIWALDRLETKKLTKPGVVPSQPTDSASK